MKNIYLKRFCEKAILVFFLGIGFTLYIADVVMVFLIYALFQNTNIIHYMV